MKRPPASLRAQAVAWLAQREHSELELRRKMMRRLLKETRGGSQGMPGPSGPVTWSTRSGVESALHAQQVDDTIAWLRERGYLDDDRFVASRVHMRSERFGLARIQSELSLHGLTVPPEAAQALRTSELERATALWQRKFGRAADDLQAAARQSRFLISRGFSGEVVRQVLRAAATAVRDRQEA